MAKAPASSDAVMAALEHPLKAEAEALRVILLGLKAPKLDEAVKWNAPSYVYSNADFVTFNLWKKDAIHLVFHHPACVTIASPLLEGDYPTRRMLYLSDMADIAAKRAELERIVGELVKLIAT